MAAASAELLRPVDGMDEHPERIFAQPVGVVRGLDDDGDNGGPALGRRESIVLVAALDPGDPERIRRGADHAGNIDGDLALADLGERIVGAGIIVERQRASSVTKS